MTARSTMEALIRIAERKVDDAAQALALRNARERDARTKLQLLIDYREEYFLRLGSVAAAGIDQLQLLNYRAFLAKLEAAIDEQHRAIDDIRVTIAAAQAQWHAEQQRLKSYQVLAERRRRSAALLMSRREQREQDEYAAILFMRPRTSA